AYALLAMGGALAIGAAQMALSVAATQDSFVLAELNSQQRALNLESQALQDQLAGLSSPQLLATKADALGMVVTGSASYLRLSDGAIFGPGEGAGWLSTDDPNGVGAVGNALLDAKAAASAESAVTGAEAGTTSAGPDLPPPITDGLPSPTTH